MKKIIAKFDGKCAKCGGKINAGESIFYDPNADRNMRAFHQGCVEQPKSSRQSPTGTANWYRDEWSNLQRFESIHEYCSLKPSPANEDLWERTLDNHRHDGKQWWGVDTLDEALHLIENGWPEGVQRLQDLASGEILDSSANNIKRRLRRGDQGDELDIHRVYAGDLGHAWTRRSRQARYTPPIITLVGMLGGAWNVSGATLFWRGAAVARLSDMLQAAGYNVEIFAADGAYDNDGDHEHRSIRSLIIPLKEASQPLDMNAIVTTLCLSGFFRYYTFRAATAWEKRINPAFGISDMGPVQKKITIEAMRRFGLNNAIVVAPDITDKKSADAWVVRTIAQINEGMLEHREAA